MNLLDWPVVAMTNTSSHEFKIKEALDMSESFAELMTRSIDERRDALRDSWSGLHGPLHYVSRSELINLFRSVNFVTDDVNLSTNLGTIYRGALIVDNARGLSWSTDANDALHYAQGYRTRGATALWKATCTPHAVLGRFNEHHEVVVDTDFLLDVTIVASFPEFPRPTPTFKPLGGPVLGSPSSVLKHVLISSDGVCPS